jgi:hypothetical protein
MENFKKCFKCEKVKQIELFYKHPEMPDGRVNKCKECNKIDVRNNYLLKSQSIEFIEKERLRSKEKYHRLNYKERQKVWDLDKEWKRSNVYKGLRRKYKEVPKTHHLHHWNYNDSFLEDIIIIERFNHRRCHNFLILDLELKIYKTTEGVLLETKEEHIKYLVSKGIQI